MHWHAAPWWVRGREEPSPWAEPGKGVHPLFPGEFHPQNHRSSPIPFSSSSSRSLYLHTKPPGVLQPNWLNGVWNALPCPRKDLGVETWLFGGFGIRACSSFGYICPMVYGLNPKHYSCDRERRSGQGSIKPHSKFCWANKNILNHEQKCENCIGKPGKWENYVYIYTYTCIGAIGVKSTSRESGQVTWAYAHGGGWEAGQSPH